MKLSWYYSAVYCYAAVAASVGNDNEDGKFRVLECIYLVFSCDINCTGKLFPVNHTDDALLPYCCRPRMSSVTSVCLSVSLYIYIYIYVCVLFVL